MDFGDRDCVIVCLGDFARVHAGQGLGDATKKVTKNASIRNDDDAGGGGEIVVRCSAVAP